MTETMIAVAPGSPDRILSRQDTAKLVNLSPSTIWRGRDEGWFPEPEYLSPNRIGWRLSVIEKWMSSPKERTKAHKETMDKRRADGRRRRRKAA